MNPAEFIAKWARTELPERAASQEHFIDLCRLLGQPTPAEHDATGAEYTFEKGVAVTAPASKGSKGEGGFADVWWRGKFGWEYKRKEKYRDLAEAYRQLCQYREALENPPLLVVSDIARTEVHTNFTGTAKKVHVVLLEDLDRPEKLNLLRRVFTDPESFRPEVTAERITNEVADQFGTLARSIQQRGHDPHTTAHFLMKCMFCLFAEDVELLPRGLFTRLLEQWKDTPKDLTAPLTELFESMRMGGAFGTERIAWFNGGLFDESPALELTGPEVAELLLAGRQDWSSVEPAIFGTLFERSLDPSKRSQIGAHYTSREDILLIVEPVLMAPVRRQWQDVQEAVDKQLQRRRKAKTQQTKRKANQRISDLLWGFLNDLSELRILDPACGSGNFLYVAIQRLLDLEKEVITFAARAEIGTGGMVPTVRPTQLHGLEINPYAAELAQVVIWIGYLQWMRDNGFNVPRDPILEPLQTIECRDAILSTEPSPQTVWAIGKGKDELRKGQPAAWPDAHFIISNPPFLGSKLFRQYEMPDEYIEGLFNAYDIPNGSDLCCYWFERARQRAEFSKRYGGKPEDQVPAGFGPAGAPPAENVRVGLLATQGIRGGANREVLKRIKETGDIFFALSDREWILDGAAVHVSMVGFDDGSDPARTLDGRPVQTVNADLTGDVDVTSAVRLPENQDIAFMGDTKGGPFDVPWDEAKGMLEQPNPNGRPNSDVLRPWVNGRDLTKRNRGMWIVDFGCEMPEAEAAGYEAPFALVEQRVKPKRIKNRRAAYAERWWIHVEPRPAIRRVLPEGRSIVTPNVTKHRLFVPLDGKTLPDHQLIAFARDDDCFFGVLQCSVHELWARRQGTQLREAESGFRYTPTTCFETFPLPWPPGEEPAGDPLYQRIADAAKALDEQRERWLNPPEWIDPIARHIDAREDFSDVPEEARELVRRSAIMAEAAQDEELRKRTLTNLYNERPTWLKLLHRELDATVLAAYAATDSEGDWSEDWADVWTESGAGLPLPHGHPATADRRHVDESVVSNLLRLNRQRAAAQSATG
jgi:type II restriction/modification system DNA methylase subunit YeeA